MAVRMWHRIFPNATAIAIYIQRLKSELDTYRYCLEAAEKESQKGIPSNKASEISPSSAELRAGTDG